MTPPDQPYFPLGSEVVVPSGAVGTLVWWPPRGERVKVRLPNGRHTRCNKTELRHPPTTEDQP